MNRFVFYAVFAALFLFFGLLIWNAEFAYKLLPIDTSPKMQVEQFETWQSYSPAIRTFSVKMPVRPQQATQSTHDPVTDQPIYYDMYVAETLAGNKYMISTITYSNGGIKKGEEMQLLTRVMEDMADSNEDSELSEISRDDFLDYPSIRYTLITDTSTVRTLAFVKGVTVFVLTGVDTGTNEGEEEFEFFINSFSFPKDSGKATGADN